MVIYSFLVYSKEVDSNVQHTSYQKRSSIPNVSESEC